MMPMLFDEQRIGVLRGLGITASQIKFLERALPLIRVDIEGYSSNADVRDLVEKVHQALVTAEQEVTKMLVQLTPTHAEAYGPIACGASMVVPALAVADLESATEGTVPELVDVPTLLRLLVTASNLSLSELPTDLYRKRAPVRSVGRILEALNRPLDEESRKSAEALPPSRYQRPFLELCECVFSAAADGRKFAVESAIKGFLETHKFDADVGHWLPAGEQPV